MIKIILISAIILVSLYFDPRVESLEFNIDLAKALLLRILTCCLLIIWLIKIRNQKTTTLKTTFLDYPILALLFINILATFFSVCPYISTVGTYYRYQGLASLINYFLVFYIIINLVSRKDSSLLIKACIVSGALVSIYGILQYFGYDFLSRLYMKIRVNSTFGNPVFFACYIMMTFILTLGMYFSYTNRKKDIFYLILASCMLWALFLTKTRACIIALFLASLFSLGILFKYLIYKHKIKFIKCCLCLGIITLVLILHPQTSPITRFFEIFQAEKIQEEMTTPLETTPPPTNIPEPLSASFGGTAKIRMFLWKDSLNIIKDNPLLGIGPEVMDIIYPRYRSQEHVRAAGGAYLRSDRAHNELLDTTISTGILGTIAYIAFYFTILFYFLRFYKKVEEKRRPLLIALLSAIVAYLIQAQLSFSNIPTSFLLWTTIATFVLSIPHSKPILKIRTIYLQAILIISIIFLLITILPPYIADTFYHKGIIERENGNLKQAMIFFEKATRIYPYEKRYPAVLIKTYLDLAQERDDIELVKKAKFVAETTIKRLPQEPAFYNILGVVLGSLSSIDNKDRIRERLKLYQRSCELDPNSPDAHYNLALLYTSLKDYTSAISEYKKAIYLTGNPLYLYNLGMLYLELKDPDKAIPLFEEIIKKHPQYKDIVNVFNTLAELYYKKQNMEGFITCYKQALEINPDNFLAAKNLGIVYFQLGDYKNALIYLEKAKNINPTDTIINNLLHQIKR